MICSKVACRLIVMLILCVPAGISIAQKDYSWEHFYTYENIVFPAATGVNYYPVAGISYHKQWADIEASPKSFLVSTNFRIGKYDFYSPRMFLNKSKYNAKEKLGLGFTALHDENGPQINNCFILSYAYHLPFETLTASFGMDISYNEIHIDNSMLHPLQPNDPNLTGEKESNWYPQAGFGLQVSNEIFFFSASAKNLLKNNNLHDIGYLRTLPDFAFYTGLTLPISRDVIFEPSTVVIVPDAVPLIFGLNAKMIVGSYNWIAFSYESLGKLSCMLVVKVIKSFQVGYGYDFYLNNVSYTSFSGHNIYIGRNLGLRNMHGIRKNVKQSFL